LNDWRTTFERFNTRKLGVENERKMG